MDGSGLAEKHGWGDHESLMGTRAVDERPILLARRWLPPAAWTGGVVTVESADLFFGPDTLLVMALSPSAIDAMLSRFSSPHHGLHPV